MMFQLSPFKSNLTPQLQSATISSSAMDSFQTSTISFRGASDYSGFAPQDIQWMQEQITKAQYIKDFELLIQSEAFQARFNDTGVLLKNFRLPTRGKNHDFLGVCDDLPRHLQKRFTEYFGDKYIFDIVSGNNDGAFNKGWEHYFLLAWPQKRNQQIRHHLEKAPRVFPEGVLLLDPSTGMMGMPNRDLKGYTLDGKSVNISMDDSLGFKRLLFTPSTSLGYRKLIDPEYKGKHKNDVVALGFKKNGQKPPEPILVLYDSNGKREPWKTWKKLPENSLLKRFLTRIQQDFKKTIALK